MRILISLVLILSLCSCGIETADSGYAGGSRNDTPISKPDGLEPPQSEVGKNGPRFISSTGGFLKLLSISSLKLEKYETFKAVSYHGSSLFVLVYRNLGNNISRWDIWGLKGQEVKFTRSCSFLHDGTISGGLAVVDSEFAMLDVNSYKESYIRVYDRSTCEQKSSLSIGKLYQDSSFYPYQSFQFFNGAYYTAVHK